MLYTRNWGWRGLITFLTWTRKLRDCQIQRNHGGEENTDSQKEIARFYCKRVKSGLGSKREMSPVQKRWVCCWPFLTNDPYAATHWETLCSFLFQTMAQKIVYCYDLNSLLLWGYKFCTLKFSLPWAGESVEESVAFPEPSWCHTPTCNASP